MNCKWYVQSNLNAIESEKIQKACAILDKEVHLFKVIPFTTRMRRLNAQPPFVLIGSTTLNRNALASRKYRHGVFFNHNFTPQHYARGYGEHFLNHDFVVGKIKDIPPDFTLPMTELFIRSNDDSKQVSGGTCEFQDLLKIKWNTEANWISGDLFTPDTEIFVSSIKEIYSEYRLCVCEGTIVGSSQYRPAIHYSVPQDILEFGREMIKVWQPHDIFVLDICETDSGPKVIECNCINGSGWYHSNYGTIVDALSTYQEKRT